MRNDVNIRPATLHDAAAISVLIAPLAEKFITHEFSETGARCLLGSLTPEAIRGYLASGFRYHVAEDNGQLLGVVGTRDNRHLYHLFVAEPAQGRGLARALWAVAKQACQDAGHAGEFTVNASQGAVGFYEKLGFERAGEDAVRNGVIAVPMRRCERTASPARLRSAR
jgi:GNAT superfamily N-acetyltransferase